MSSEICPNVPPAGVLNIPPCGILLVDKPSGFSSHDIVAIARGIFGIKKIRHSGTLDPMATGLLILLIGKNATCQQPRFLRLGKVYSGTLQLGQETDSWDAEGEIIAEKEVPALTQEALVQAAHELTGDIEQPIPFYSAKKINGQKMYSLARAGEPMERQFSTVNVVWPQVRLVSPRTIEFVVCCSSGTYVRALGYLLAHKLGTVGHLTQLRRLEIGPYNVADAFDGAKLKETPAELLCKRIIRI